MVKPILGLYGLEAIGYEENTHAEELVRTARSLAIDFPEKYPAAASIAELQKILSSLEGKMKIQTCCPLDECRSVQDCRNVVTNIMSLLGVGHLDCIVFGPVSMRQIKRIEAWRFDEFLQELKDSNVAGSTGLWIADRVEYIGSTAQSLPHLDCVRIDYTPLDYIDRPGAYAYKVAERNDLKIISSSTHTNRSGVSRYPDSVKNIFGFPDSPDKLSRQLLKWLVMINDSQSIVLFPYSADELADDIAAIGEAEGGRIRIADKLMQNNLKDALVNAQPIYCTACGCCMPCRFGVDIPGIVAAYNEASVYGNEKTAALLYKILGHDEVACRNCRICIDNCPKGNQIPTAASMLKKWFDESHQSEHY